MKSMAVRQGDVPYLIAVVLLVLWGVAVASAYTLGGFIHALLVIAAVIVLVRVIGGRKPV